MATVPSLDASAPVEEMRAALERDGCLILRNYMDPLRAPLVDFLGEVRAIQAKQEPDVEGMVFGQMRISSKAKAKRTEAIFGQGNSEGMTYFPGSTHRITALITNTPSVRNIITDPRMLAICDAALKPNCTRYQVHSTNMLTTGPGARRQILHREEDGFQFIPGPPETRPNLVLATMIAATDFTRENGATLIVPGSHKWPHERKATDEEVAQGVMPAGSVMVWLGRTLHAAGANLTQDNWRQGLCLVYSVGWLRTEENQNLDVPPRIARILSPELRALVGYEERPGTTDGLGFFDRHLVDREEELMSKL